MYLINMILFSMCNIGLLNNTFAVSFFAYSLYLIEKLAQQGQSINNEKTLKWINNLAVPKMYFIL